MQFSGHVNKALNPAGAPVTELWDVSVLRLDFKAGRTINGYIQSDSPCSQDVQRDANLLDGIPLLLLITVRGRPCEVAGTTVLL